MCPIQTSPFCRGLPPADTAVSTCSSRILKSMKTQTPTKILLTACTIAASLIGFGASSRADNYIGASFMGRNINGTVNAGEIAGAPGFQQKNWNNIDDNRSEERRVGKECISR